VSSAADGIAARQDIDGGVETGLVFSPNELLDLLNARTLNKSFLNALQKA
jgi:hypothetical protein